MGDDDRLNFGAVATMFSQQFYALGGFGPEPDPGDALLVLSVGLPVFRMRASPPGAGAGKPFRDCG